MAQKGVKYDFEPGEYALCFEPDATKARVLYDAKILDYASSRDKRGNWRPEYQVHFQGWNSSWDRIVPETFVQKNSAENRALMKRLAIVARNVKKNRSRKRRIDVLLKQHFKRKMPPESSDESSTDDSTDDDDDDDNEMTEVDDYEEEVLKENQSTTGDETENIENEDESQCQSDEDKEYSDGLELHGPNHVELEVPCELRAKLEDDCYMITRKKKVVSLPADPNVLTVLEGHVKNFALNILYGAAEKSRLRDHQNNLPERNIDLCKEVMDGLRIFFDFALPTILLYNSERTHYEKAMTSFKPTVNIKKEVVPDSPVPEVTSPRLRSATRHAQSPDAPGDISPCPLMNSPRAIKRERADDFSDEDVPPRRMTRHAYQAELRGRKVQLDKNKTGPESSCPGTLEKRRGTQSERSECSDNGVASGETRRESLRSSTRHSHLADALNNSASGMGLSDRLTPPPPLLIPSVISSKASKGSSSPHHTPTYKSRCSTPTLMDQMDKEGMMNGVLAWKLIPDDAYTGVSPAPSHVCGAIHLLRFFVRLPELINQMSIPDSGLKALIKHLWLLLEYMADNSEELFPESAYVDAPDAGRGSAAKH